MSTLKIVGIENELRLDCSDDKPEYMDYHMLDEYYLPHLLVNLTLKSSSAVLALDRELSGNILDREVSDLIREDNLDMGQINKIVLEHIERDRGLGRNLSPKAQAFGFSGGYTPSGHRIYVDGSHPEVCTPECSSPRDLVCWEKAGEDLLKAGIKILKETEGYGAVLYKNNSDGLGHSWGSHENYLVNKELFYSLTEEQSKSFNMFQAAWITFLVSRIIYTGAGKVGYDAEIPGQAGNVSENLEELFLLSQRTEFLTEKIGHNTTELRPWINTRDIPYVGKGFGRRLHVIAGDSNLCEVSLYLRTGMSMIVLMMLEDEPSGSSLDRAGWPIVNDIFEAAKSVNEDVGCRKLLDVSVRGEPKKINAIDIQNIILEKAWQWYHLRCKNDHEAEKIAWIPDVLNKLHQVLACLMSGNREGLFGKIDWITKLLIINERLLRLKAGRGGDGSYMKSLDLAYHRLDEDGIFSRVWSSGRVESIVDTDSVNKAVSVPPNDTRANNRGTLIANYSGSISLCNWHCIVFPDRAKILLASPWRI